MGQEEDAQQQGDDGNPKLINSSYQMRPPLSEVFKGNKVKEIIRQIMFQKLQGKNYNYEEVKNWTRDIADSVNATIKDELEMPRYKYVVQVMLGQQLGAGCHYYSKCCWDAETDSQTSDVFTNTSLFCVTTVFGVYLY